VRVFIGRNDNLVSNINVVKKKRVKVVKNV